MMPPISDYGSVTGRATTARSLPTETVRIGRARDNDIVVADLLVSRHHTELRGADGHQPEIVDLGSSSGTYVNGHRVGTARIGPDDIVRIGRSTFRLVGRELRQFVDAGEVFFAAHHLGVRTGDGKVLLDNVSFPLGERCLLAVIGPSGAGKSTLLAALCGLVPTVEGGVWYDNRDLSANYPELSRRIALVPQDDILHTQLPVRRALRYAAELRFAGDTDRAERECRVDEVIRELGLEEQAEQRIDSLSGGQRKRVNIALELLTMPSVLLLDEPTSGLDPGLDESVMQTLRRLADEGRSIIVTTHSVLCLHLCDRVLILATGGQLAFYGPPDEALLFLRQPRWSTAFLDLGRTDRRDWAENFRASTAYQRFVATPLHRPTVRRDGVAALPSPVPAGPGRVGQLWTLVRRYLALIAADRYFLTFLVGLPIVLGILTRSVPARQGLAGAPGSNAQALQLLLTLVICACLAGSANAVREVVKERNVYRRESSSGLSPSAYLCSKLVVLGSISGVQAVTLTVIGLAGRAQPARGAVLGRYPMLEIMAALAGLAIASMAVGLVISASVRTAETTMPLLVVVTMGQVVLSGALMPLSDRAGLNWLSLLSPSRWALAAIASTIDLHGLLPRLPPRPPDAMWHPQPNTWLFNMAALLVLTAALSVAVLWRLRQVGPALPRPSNGAVTPGWRVTLLGPWKSPGRATRGRPGLRPATPPAHEDQVSTSTWASSREQNSSTLSAVDEAVQEKPVRDVVEHPSEPTARCRDGLHGATRSGGDAPVNHLESGFLTDPDAEREVLRAASATHDKAIRGAAKTADRTINHAATARAAQNARAEAVYAAAVTKAEGLKQVLSEEATASGRAAANRSAALRAMSEVYEAGLRSVVETYETALSEAQAEAARQNDLAYQRAIATAEAARAEAVVMAAETEVAAVALARRVQSATTDQAESTYQLTLARVRGIRAAASEYEQSVHEASAERVRRLAELDEEYNDRVRRAERESDLAIDQGEFFPAPPKDPNPVETTAQDRAGVDDHGAVGSTADRLDPVCGQAPRTAAAVRPDAPSKDRPSLEARPAALVGQVAPRLARDIELLGECRGSGFAGPHFLVRRGDGQSMQMSRLLYLLVSAIDGQRDADALAAHISEAYGETLDRDGVNYLLAKKLAPLGLLESTDDEAPEAPKARPLPALSGRHVLLPASAANAVAKCLQVLFWPPVVVLATAGLAALDIFAFTGHGVFATHGVAADLQRMLVDPYLLLPVLALVLVFGFFHELGHAAGCRYGGGRAGAISVGVHIVWPAFYADVTDAYRFGRGGRLRTDLGGVYFNAVTVLLLGAGYLLTRFPPLLITAVVIQYQMICQILPLVRLDSYYVLGDLFGVHDLFGRVGPILRSLVPGRPMDRRLRELKVGVRLVVGVWVLVVVTFLAVNLALLVVHLPAIVIQTEESISREAGAVALAVTSRNVVEATTGVVNILILVIAAAGIVFLLARSSIHVVRMGLQRSRGRLQMRIGLAAAGLAPLILLLTTWWKAVAR